jgi:hypothetical protein
VLRNFLGSFQSKSNVDQQPRNAFFLGGVGLI